MISSCVLGLFVCLNIFMSFGSAAEKPTTPPSIHDFIKGPIYSNRKVTLECKATGGEMSYEWFINETKAVNHVTKVKNGAELEIEVKEDSSGYYQCKAKNGLGVAVSDTVLVNLKNFYISKIPDVYKKVKEGAYIELQCPEVDQLQPRPLLKWKRNDVEVVSDVRRQVDSKGTLHIAYATKEDEAKFECILIDGMNPTTQFGKIDYDVTVEDDAQASKRDLVLQSQTISPATGLKGHNITLRCVFSGAKRIEVDWYNMEDIKVEGTRIRYSDYPAMTIINLKDKDAKRYKCKAKTANGKSSEGFVDVIVDELPNFESPKDHPKDTYETTGSIATFRCNATGKPEPTVEWFKNGDLITTVPQKMHISADKKTLKVSPLCKNCNDDMVVQCKASNNHGHVYENGFLKIYDPTKITLEPVDVEFDKEENVTFTCNAITDQETTLRYKWQFKDKDFNSGNVKTDQEKLLLNIPFLRQAKIDVLGKWTCIANNSFSSAKSDAYLKEKRVAAFPNWWILLLVLLLLLLLLLIACCVCNYLYKNRGSVYPVDEIEHKNGNDPEKELLEYGFHDYQRDVTNSTSGTLRSQRSMGSTNSLARGT